jgi:hypothetical protein
MLFGTEFALLTAVKVNNVGSKRGLRLNDHSDVNSFPTKPELLIVSRTKPGFAASSNVALTQGDGPAGGVPPENSKL